MALSKSEDQNRPAGRLPNALIVGTQKSGTTWLHASLGKSPQVFASETKELNFFNKQNYLKNLNTYKRNFPDTPDYSYFLESTPHYFRLPFAKGDISQKIKGLLGTPKLITLFRNPIDRYESAYTHHMMRGRFAYSPELTDMIDNFSMLSFGKYAEITTHWKKTFPDIGLFFYDDIQNDPVSLVGQVMGHLGLKNDIPDHALRFRTNAKKIKMRKLPQIADWDRLPALSPPLRQKLRDYYHNDILELQTITGRDLSHWLDL